MPTWARPAISPVQVLAGAAGERIQSPVDEGHQAGGHQCGQSDALEDVLADVVAEFVGEDDGDLIVVECVKGACR